MATLVKTSPLFLERYELKYLIRPDQVPAIEEFIAPYCELDPYCEGPGFYRINTLYVDSTNSVLFTRRMSGQKNRFNMRIRSYGIESNPPYFLEIKHKSSGYVRKYRSKIMASDVEEAIFNPPFDADKNYALFSQLATLHGVEPKVMTSYDRVAYLSVVDDYARVTFDRNLRYHRPTDWMMKPDLLAEMNYDNETLFPPDRSIILELKSTVRVPMWLHDLIGYFQLERGGFSKFSNSFRELISSDKREASDVRTPINV